MKINITAEYDVVIDPEGHGYDVNITLKIVNTTEMEEIYSTVTSSTVRSMSDPLEGVIAQTLVDTYCDIGVLMTHTIVNHTEIVATTVNISSLREKLQEVRKKNVSENQ